MNIEKTNEIMSSLRSTVEGGNVDVVPEDLPYLQCLALFEIAYALDQILRGMPEAGRGI